MTKKNPTATQPPLIPVVVRPAAGKGGAKTDRNPRGGCPDCPRRCTGKTA